MDDLWMVYGRYVVDIWMLYGWFMDDLWMVYGRECGRYMDALWMVYGWFMVDIWNYLHINTIWFVILNVHITGHHLAGCSF